ncbi:hypothetical protein COL516b_010261 [Colletotrichum fioriniae]|nr:uncharacterized protein COL516b_010261 [Colletotrichum fioriniae]KAJ0297896.1 hypothetical protein COL516b_010261 [Colletotrichum fioriniae]
MTKNGEKLKVGVIGPAGFGGSYLVVELINRGHRVVGLSRNPQKLGTHELYEPRPINLETSTEGELATAISDLEVVVCEYGPHTAGHEALQYKYIVTLVFLSKRAEEAPRRKRQRMER